jgi:succinylglutamic semialdehyde dehydrogenase
MIGNPRLNHLIRKQWVEGEGPQLSSHNPATGQLLWSGRAASAADVRRAVAAARWALPDWSTWPLNKRAERLHAFGSQLKAHRDDLAETISLETGKPRWEAFGEVDLMFGKIGITLDAFAKRRSPQSIDLPDAVGKTRFHPHGVMAVLGPFNMPGHLPNSHIMPALLAGNTIVFKPSEFTPLVGESVVHLWLKADLPAGVINLVQGSRDTGEALAQCEGIDGLLFTGSYAAGQAIHRLFADHPEKLLALEMGGNNPLIICQVSDLRAASYLTVVSAYLTAGQRCTCARRLILPDAQECDRLLDRLVPMIETLAVGPFTDQPEPFMGPVINAQAAERLLQAQARLISRGARAIVPMTPIDTPTMLRPGLIDVTDVRDRTDEEYFGPLLQLIRVRDFNAAIDEASRTAYGLAAALFSDDNRFYREFASRIRAGIINWNRPTIGASAQLPFGGAGKSGNHRPSGYYAVDYCAYPVASLETRILNLPPTRLPGVRL